jgi:deoxyribodipyrimidine photo-lyase
MMQSSVPEIRIRQINERPVRPDGDFVLYRMLAYRRLSWNFALQRAVEWAAGLDRPLVIFEEVPLEAPWASVRSHSFILDGIRDHLQACENLPVLYYPYLEVEAGAARALLETLGQKACLLVVEDSPVQNALRPPTEGTAGLPVRVEAVDSNGLLPLRASDRDYPTAYSFRRFLQKELPGHLLQAPLASPWQNLAPITKDPLDADLLKRWPPLSLKCLQAMAGELKKLPINQGIVETPRCGGAHAARQQLDLFLDERLAGYHEQRNEPEKHGTSELSSYLRHGQIATHQVFHRIAERQGWSLQRLAPQSSGKRAGWWGMDASTEAFLDELVTWRELGYNMAAHRPDYRDYASLPEWARRSLAAHRQDFRPYLYSLEQFDQAETHDPLWNAAQTQLRAEGVIHNYLRMLWGKKILEWTKSPEQAAEVMIELNNRYALDGCDPNSYSGIYWCLGRYDRAWGPERPVFGKIRYMTSENTARKYSVRKYLQWYAGA